VEALGWGNVNEAMHDAIDPPPLKWSALRYGS
jgi:hypothetical protein